MLDLKNWFNPKHYKRLWNVGPPGLITSLLLIYLTLQYEAALNIKKYETGHTWIDVLFFLILLEMLFILFWTLFSLPPKHRGKKTIYKRNIFFYSSPRIYGCYFSYKHTHIFAGGFIFAALFSTVTVFVVV